MKPHQLVFSVLILSACVGCSQGPVGKMIDSPDSTNSASSAEGLMNTNEAAAMAIIQNNCTSCHTASSGPGNIYDLTNLAHLTSTGLVVVGNPNQSELYTEIASGNMPPTGALSAADQTTIFDWINAH